MQAEEEQACPAPQEEEEEVRVLTLPLQAHHAMEKMEEFVYKVQPAGICPGGVGGAAAWLGGPSWQACSGLKTFNSLCGVVFA